MHRVRTLTHDGRIGPGVIPLTLTAGCRLAHPGAHIGVLELSGVDNRASCAELDARKRALEKKLRERYGGFSRADFVALPVMREYVRYYRRFEKTYHVLLQLESVALKGKALPSVSPLVDANFCAELDTLVLAAGHDAARLQPPVCIDVSGAGDGIVQMGGAAKQLPAGDMVMRDATAVSCSILYGQDNRSPILASTTSALYVAYAPGGVGAAAVRAQLEALLSNVRSFAPACTLEQLEVLGVSDETARA